MLLTCVIFTIFLFVHLLSFKEEKDFSFDASYFHQDGYKQILKNHTQFALDITYEGVNKNNDPFIIRAAKAFRVEKDKKEYLSLKNPWYIFKTEKGEEYEISSENGFFDIKKNILEMTENVRLKRSDGFEFTTLSAYIDCKNIMIKGNEKVTGHGPQGRIQADGFYTAEKGNRLFFIGQSCIDVYSS